MDYEHPNLAILLVTITFLILTNGQVSASRVAPARNLYPSQISGVTYHGGPILTDSFLYIVFWGSDWQSHTDLLQQIYSGLQTVIAGHYLDSLDQYGYGSLQILGYTINNVYLPQNTVVKESDIWSFAASLVSSGTIPKYDSQILVILPTRHDVSMEHTSRFEIGGYHWYTYSDQQDSRSILAYSIVETGSLIEDFLVLQRSFGLIVAAATHEIVEAITDPTGQGWYSPNPGPSEAVGEIADLNPCHPESQFPLVSSLSTINGVPVSSYWSDVGSQCAYQGGTGLEPFGVALSGIPTGKCVTVSWTTSLQAFAMPVCNSMQWIVRGTTGSSVSVDSIININQNTRYMLTGSSAWTLNPSQIVPATFVEQFSLTVNSQYGNVQGGGWYDANSIATVSLQQTIIDLTQDTRARFQQWSGDASSKDIPLQITMDSPKSVSAEWVNQYYVTVTSPYGNAQGSGWYDQGSTGYASLDQSIVSAGASVRYSFSGWTGSESSPNSQFYFSISGSMTISAAWTTQYYVSVASQPSSLPQISGSGWYDSGHTFTAQAPSFGGYSFTSWTINSQTSSGSSLAISITGPTVIVANYEASGQQFTQQTSFSRTEQVPVVTQPVQTTTLPTGGISGLRLTTLTLIILGLALLVIVLYFVKPSPPTETRLDQPRVRILRPLSAAVPPVNWYCRYCGRSVDPISPFCCYCGRDLR